MTTSKVVETGIPTAYEKWELPLVHNEGRMSASEVESIRQTAYDEGFSQGKNDGLTAANNEAAQKMQIVNELLTMLSRPLDDIDDGITLQLGELAMAVARQVVRRELNTDSGEIVGIVREAISMLPASEKKVSLRMHPEDAKLIRSVFSFSSESTDAQEMRWSLIEDPVLSRGGCHITSEHSTIDATVEGRLNRVINSMLGGERDSDA